MRPFGCQEWPWVSFWRGQGLDLQLLPSMRESRDAGFECWEGTLPQDSKGLDELAAALEKSGLSLPSLYANARLHDAHSLQAVADLVTRCEKARPLGFSVLVLNPEPIDWSTREEKSDEALAIQARGLKALQGILSAAGIGLAYHIHDSEMRSDGRELLAMITALPELNLCMEAEWMLRAGWSGARTLEFISTRAKQMTAAHLRQGRDRKPLAGLWEGDMDYPAAALMLGKAGFKGPVTYEGYQESKMELEEMRGILKRNVVWMKENF